MKAETLQEKLEQKARELMSIERKKLSDFLQQNLFAQKTVLSIKWEGRKI